MASYLRSFNPIPSFPEYTGPHKVGTIDVEIPVSELDSPSPAPEGAVNTVQYRIFYPCQNESKSSPSINWLPNPQKAHIAAYTRFLGAGSTLSEFVALFPRLLYWITIPVCKNAPLLQPTTPNQRWPVMIFSHGLGGSRNAYSHLVGSVASHGMIVICPEHRDGSTPISFVRNVLDDNGSAEKSKPTGNSTVDYIKISHSPSPEVETARTKQLKIRLWELGCIHDSLLKIDDKPSSLTNLNTSSASLEAFASKLDIHEPGSITFAGHSFGAATVAQFIKTVYYSTQAASAPSSYEPLFSPSSRSVVLKQISPNTPTVLLDMWCFPMRASTTTWLWNKPMPCYAPTGPGGNAILAVESQAFVKWRTHLLATKRFLSHDPSSESTKPEQDSRAPPHFYYPATSAHLSQSDFGILFPWITKRIFASEEPERCMKLNVRAILQLLRERGVPVSATSREDMELGSEIAAGEEVIDDKHIFGTNNEIRGWTFLSTDASNLSDVAFEKPDHVNKQDEKTTPAQAVVDGELGEEKGEAASALGAMEGTPGSPIDVGA